MWKRSEEPSGKSVSPANPFKAEPAGSTMPQSPERRVETEPPAATASSIAHIGKSVQIKGELSGSEDLHIDGKVEGSIELRDHCLTIGNTGKVRANVNARKVVIYGSAEGNMRATDTVDIRKSGSLLGDLVVAGVSIEEGAYFKGSIDIQKSGEAEAKRSEPKRVESSSEGDSKFAAAAGGAKRPQ